MLEWLFHHGRQVQRALILAGVLIVVLLVAVMPVSVLQSSIRLATPFVLGSLAALIANRAGVLNLAIEGKMLLGAFIGVAVLYQTNLNPVVGTVAAMFSGGVLGLIFAVLYLRIRINLIVLALALNLFVADATVFFMRVWFNAYGTLADPSIRSLPIIRIPIINDIPVVGTLLSGYNIIVYISWLMVFMIWLILFRTQFGRHIRAVGENKEAAETAGINVTRVQIFALTLSGFLAGMAGAFLSLGILSQFLENMTAGRGWIALTVAIFALNRPIAAFATALFFGFAEAYSLYLVSRPGIDLPADWVLMLPQIATLVALILVGLRIRGSEAIKRRTFVRQFSQELQDVKNIFIGDGKRQAAAGEQDKP
jgi:general nucleoside transport system permease protein